MNALPTHLSPLRPDDPHRSSLPDGSAQLAHYLYRPIVFREPDRVVPPPSWLEHIPFAFWIVDVLRPAVLVELGTHSGNSYAAFAQAVQMLGLSTAAYAVDTWQGDAQSGFYDEGVFAEWTSYHDRHFSAFSRLIRSTFEEAVQHFADGSIDLLHVDGCHTYDAASADFERWRPKLSRRGVVLLHDINVRERDFGTWRLWEELNTQSPSFAFLHGHGLGVIAAGSDVPEALQWLFSRSSSCPTDVGAVRQFFAQLGGAVSARFAAAEIESKLHAEFNGIGKTTGTGASPAALETSNLERQLARQRALHDKELSASRGQAALEISNLEGQLIHERALHDEELSASRGQAALEISNLESQLIQERRQHEVAQRHKAQLIAALQERLGDESRRRTNLEAERGQLTANRHLPSLSSNLQHRLERVDAGLLRRLRYMRRVSRTPAALGLLPTVKRWTSGSVLRFAAGPSRLREAHVIAMSGLFDEAYYRRCYPDVAASRLTPLAHFLLRGAREGRNPHPLFDSAYYLRNSPDVASANVNPLFHYTVIGAFEGRSPHPLFDVAFYLQKNPDVKSTGTEPLSHFLTCGVADGRDPNPFFDSTYYLRRYPDVAASGTNPLVHFVCDGWREGRRASAAFDTAYYLSQNADVRFQGVNPLAHYIEHGRSEGRSAVADHDDERSDEARRVTELPPVLMKVHSLAHSHMQPPVVLCLSHVMPWPPRAGNEYRIYRLLRWLRDQGYRVVPVIAPLPGERVETDALHALAEHFSNAVLCDRDGRLEYVLRDVPDVLSSLRGELTRPIATLLDEDTVQDARQRQLLHIDRTFCHDALITTTLRLLHVLDPCVLLAEYIWMSRILPLVSPGVLKVIDTIDVFSTKREKVLQFGIDDLHVEASEETKRLGHADLILAIQDEERQELEQLLPGKRIVTAGVDFDVVEDPGVPSGRHVLYVASGNPMNRKGLSDFLRFAWPHIRREVPDATLLVAGRVGSVLNVDVPGVIRLGPVDDLKPLYSRARVVINPAVAGTGLKIKTLEALGHLRPIVTWPSGTEGLAPELAAFCMTVQDWYEFSRRVAGVLAMEEPPLFSRPEHDTIVRLTAPATAYRAMTEAIADLRETRDASEPAASGIRG
jgi:hypothetical protein